MRSNCHLWAWSRFVEEGGYIAFRQTRVSRFAVTSPEWWWCPFWALGVVLQHVGSYVVFIGWLLRWRTWYHAFWIDPNCEWWEFRADENPEKKLAVTPIIFKGSPRKVSHETLG